MHLTSFWRDIYTLEQSWFCVGFVYVLRDPELAFVFFRMENDSTPPRGSLAINVDVVRANLSSLTLTPSRVTPSNASSRKRNARGMQRRLFSSAPVFEEPAASVSHSRSRQPWSTGESRALVSFLLLCSEGSSWTSRKEECFWEKAGQYVQNLVQSEYCRTGQS